MGDLQLGHFVLLPAALSGALTDALQVGQLNRMGMGHRG